MDAYCDIDKVSKHIFVFSLTYIESYDTINIK